MTVMPHTPDMGVNLLVINRDINDFVDVILRILAFVLSFLTAIFVRFQIRRRLYGCWVYALFALVLSSILCFGVLSWV